MIQLKTAIILITPINKKILGQFLGQSKNDERIKSYGLFLFFHIHITKEYE